MALLCLPVAGAHSAESEEVLPPSDFLSGKELTDLPPAEGEESFDWEKRVVSRGVGGRSGDVTEEPPAVSQQYSRGQSAYFFRQYQQARDLWQPLAEAGFADAQASLAWLYQAGLGVDKDLQQALHWYQLAAKQQHAVALNNLGVFYQQGQIVKKDLQQAQSLFKKSAQQGYRFAQFNLAELLLQQGAARDEAIFWLKAAADNGVTQARERLAELQAGDKTTAQQSSVD